MKQGVKTPKFMKGGAFGALGDMTSHTSLPIQIPLQLGSRLNYQPAQSVIAGLGKRRLTSGYFHTANNRNFTKTFIPSNELISIYNQENDIRKISVICEGAFHQIRIIFQEPYHPCEKPKKPMGGFPEPKKCRHGQNP